MNQLFMMYGGGNSITAGEVSKFQCFFPNLQLVDARKASGHQKLSPTPKDSLMMSGPQGAELTLIKCH